MTVQWTDERRTLGELIPWERNPRQIRRRNAERLVDSVQSFGQVEPLIVGPTNELYNGHQRLAVLMQTYGPEYAVDVRVASRELSEKEREKLTVYLHKGATGEFDFDALANDFELSELVDWGFEPFELGLGDFAAEVTDDDTEGDGSDVDDGDDLTDLYNRWDVPDALWASDNDWGVPLLDLNMQAQAFDQPWQIWGSVARTTRMAGTWLFYTTDDRYEALWRDPSGILNTHCAAAVEPNFSAYSNMPKAVALWQVYRKRWIARWWQSYGVRLWVDLNVAQEHYDVNMLGIPAGWKSFATRGYTDRIDNTHMEYEQAKRIAGEDVTPLFLVYGGGKAVKAECQRMGWLWLQENMDTGKGLEV